MTLGEKLYTLRTKQNMTQEQLAEKLQVSRQSISKWESDATRPDLGKLKCISFGCWMRICSNRLPN